MTVMRVCYKAGVRFDEQYYTSKHLPMVGSVMGPYGVSRVEMVKVTAMLGGGAPTYQVIFSAYFESPSTFERAMQDARMPEVLGDISNFYDGMPDVFVGEVVSLPAPPR
jgi:uncharacterized protein (TIGR02118 family)